MSGKKRVLLLCHDFPPVNSMAARRPAAWAKYLPEFGWEPFVITSTEAGRISEPMSEEEVQRSTGGLRTVMRVAVPPRSRHAPVRISSELWDLTVLPGTYSRRRAGRVLAECHRTLPNFDAVISTYPETWPLLAARQLSGTRNRPWVADFRDLPDQLPIPGWVGRAAVWRVRQLTREASHVVVVSDHHAGKLGHAGQSISVIPNGFDPELAHPATAPPAVDVFRIVYTGKIVRGQCARPVVQAVSELVEAGETPAARIALEFHGTQPRAFREQVDSMDLVMHPTLCPQVSLSEALQRQRSATVLLLLQLVDPAKALGVFTGKVYEYLAARRPILLYPADRDGIGKLLAAAGAGVGCHDETELKAVLLGWYREWERTGDICLTVKTNEVEKYNRKRQVQRVAEILDQVTATRNG